MYLLVKGKPDRVNFHNPDTYIPFTATLMPGGHSNSNARNSINGPPGAGQGFARPALSRAFFGRPKECRVKKGLARKLEIRSGKW
jgi:hypothetical protein